MNIIKRAMKKKILNIHLLIIGNVSYAQQAINNIFPYSSTPPTVNISLSYNDYVINNTLKVQKNGGANIVWAYDSCQLLPTPFYSIDIADTTNKPGSSTVAGRANVSINEYGNPGYSFYDLNNKLEIAAQSFNIFGNAGFVTYNNNIQLGNTPFNYGYNISTNDTANQWVFATTNFLRRYTSSTLSYDGYGSLKLNNTLTIDSIARIKLVQLHTDSLLAPAGGFIKKIKTKTTTYYYMRKRSFPEAIWSYDSIVGTTALGTNLPAEQFRFIIHTDHQTVNSINSLKENELLIYPNPTTHLVNIKSDTQIKAAFLIDVLGRRFDLQITNNTIDVSKFEKGTYLLKIESTGNSYAKRIIIQ